MRAVRSHRKRRFSPLEEESSRAQVVEFFLRVFEARALRVDSCGITRIMPNMSCLRQRAWPNCEDSELLQDFMLKSVLSSGDGLITATSISYDTQDHGAKCQDQALPFSTKISSVGDLANYKEALRRRV